MELAGLFPSGGFLNGKRILSEESVRMMTESQTGSLSPKRAFGFLVQDTDAFAGSCFSPRAFGHTGFTGTSIWMDPEIGMEAVILTNRVHHGRFVNIEKIKRFRKRIHTALVREYF
jgi:CubicO group peptidase (beta-lactamase class C family)